MGRCNTHREEHVGPCNWCGSKLCGFCITKRNGSLIYCEKCSVKLNVRARVPKPRKQLPEMELHESPKKPTLTNDGYLDLT